MECHGPHHVVLFMTEDMAVPHVFPRKVFELVRGHPRIAGNRVDLRQLSGRAERCCRVQRTPACRQTERKLRLYRLDGNNGIFQRADPYGLFPAHLGRVRQADKAVPADAVEDLNIKEVKVDRVRVNTIVRDLPDLDAVRIEVLGNGRAVRLDNEVDLQRAAICLFKTEGCTHTAVIIEGRAHLIMDRLPLHGIALHCGQGSAGVSKGLELNLRIVDTGDAPVRIDGREYCRGS